jgi:hypothetical protein
MADKPLLNSEPKLRVMLDGLATKYGTVLSVADQPASIGALSLAVARDAGCEVAKTVSYVVIARWAVHGAGYVELDCSGRAVGDRPQLRKWLRGKRIGVRIARKGTESSERLGRRRWVIERTMSWLSGYRRLSPRYERDPRNYLAFLGLAAALCCYKRLLRLTT